MMSLKKIIAIGMVAATALTSSAISMAAAPAAQVYAADEKETAHYDGEDLSWMWGDKWDRTNALSGNYVYVKQYADKEGKKVKGAYLTDNSGYFSLGGFNLKKETYWKVFDETMKEEDVKIVTIPAQSKKVKISIKDATAKTVDKFFSVKIDGKETTDTKALFGVYIYDDYESEYYRLGVNKDMGNWSNDTLDCDENGIDDVVEYIRGCATGAVSTTILYTHQEVATSGGIGKYSPSFEGKFKIPAAPKAPKVTVDYVNGTYKLPKGSEYAILSVSENGIIEFLEEEATRNAVDVKAKTNIVSVDKIFETGVKDDILDKEATGAAIYVYTAANGKKFASQPTLIKVEKLATATMAGGTVAMSGTAVTVKDAKVTVGTNTIAEIKVVESKDKNSKEGQITIDAKANIQYSTDGKKWINVKSGKSSKPFQVKKGAEILIKSVGVKATKDKEGTFGSEAAKIVVGGN